jgi:hypothetical protein
MHRTATAVACMSVMLTNACATTSAPPTSSHAATEAQCTPANCSPGGECTPDLCKGPDPARTDEQRIIDLVHLVEDRTGDPDLLVFLNQVGKAFSPVHKDPRFQSGGEHYALAQGFRCALDRFLHEHSPYEGVTCKARWLKAWIDSVQKIAGTTQNSERQGGSAP